MRPFSLLILFFLSTACVSTPSPHAAITPTPTLTNPWLGQSLPGATPRQFASGSFHSSPTFSPDGQVVYWGGEYSTKTIYTRRLAAGDWTPASIIYFSEDMRSYRDPFISPDGERLYFISDDALPGESSSGKENIWMMEKEGEGWGTPQPLPDLINAYRLHWTISVAANYNLYFSANEADIYISRYLDGNYTEPVLLDPPVNTDELEITPNIAPDESYLLFTRVATKSDPPYLFISYAIGSGWSEPQRIENIDYCISPIVTPDRQYVIYMSSPYSLAWRDTTFINELWP